MEAPNMTQSRSKTKPKAESAETKTAPEVPALEDATATLRDLKDAVMSGAQWHVALLEAVGKWTATSEELHGRCYQYLLSGEAFDWLLLAERLCHELDGMIPGEEKETLIFHGKMPAVVSPKEFRALVGFNKHQAILNYWYGVVVEEALQLAVEEEVRKQHRAKGFADSEELAQEAFRRIYEESRSQLLLEFAEYKGWKVPGSLGLTELNEFTYWLFKRRVKFWDPARVGSDTRKGLEKLASLRGQADSFALGPTPTTHVDTAKMLTRDSRHQPQEDS